jgi:leader peptidase (prepilin peptidase)/N-methyltransferase
MIASTSLFLLSLASALLAWIDLRRGLIPDWLNVAIAALGLARAFALDGWAAALLAGCEGVAVGLAVWILRELYFLWRRYQGLGLGDVKLLAASAVWIGIPGIPIQLMVASLTALVVAAALQSAGRTMTRQTSLPFGPYLALGLLAALGLQQGGVVA